MVKDNPKNTKVVAVSHPRVQKKINKTLNQSLTQGCMTSTFLSTNPSYIAPFALLMQASASHIGILGAIEILFPALSQLGSAKLIEKYSRKKIMIMGAIFSALIWIPIMLTAMLFFNNISYTIWVLIGFVGIFHMIMGLIYPAWFSLMGSLVPEQERGKYFSRRNRYTQFFSVVSMIASAVFLDYMKKIGSASGEAIGYTFLGFFVLFTIGMGIRSCTAVIFSKHYEPRLKIRKKDHYTLKKFIKDIKHSPFGRFTLFNAILRIGVGLMTPFVVVYLLRDLGYSYTWLMIIVVSSVMFQIFFLKIIGNMSDQFGNIALTKFAALFITLVPLAWALSYYIPHTVLQKIYLIFFAQIIAGIGWGALNLAMQNYVYDSSQTKQQGYAIAYMNLFNGIGFFIGAVAGSIFVKMTFLSINVIVAVFLLAFIIRGITILIGSRYLKEVRNVKPFDPNYFIHEIHPIKGTIAQIHNLNHARGRIIHHI